MDAIFNIPIFTHDLTKLQDSILNLSIMQSQISIMQFVDYVLIRVSNTEVI